MDKKYKRLFKNIGLIMFGGLLTKAFSFLMLPLYTRWLSPADYGITDIVTVYASLLTSLITLCIADAIFVFPKNASEGDRKKYYTSAYVFTAILFAIAAIIFFCVSTWMISNGEENIITRYAWFIYAIIGTTFLQNLTQQFTIAIDKVQVYSYTGLVYAISLACLSVVLVTTYHVKGYMYSMLLANIIAISYTVIVSKSYKYISRKSISFCHYKEMTKYSIPLVPNAIMWWLVSGINRPLLEANVSFDEIGIYAVGQKIPSIISMVFIFFSQSWQISVLEEYGKDSFEAYFNKIIKLSTILLFSIGACVFIFGDFILRIVTTEQFYAASALLPCLCASVVFSGLSGQFGSIYGATKTTKYLFYSSIWSAATAVVLNLILIPRFGVVGAVWSTVASFAVMLGTRVYWCNKLLKIRSLKTILFTSILYSLTVFLLDKTHMPIMVISFFLSGMLLQIFVDKELKSALILVIKKIHL